MEGKPTYTPDHYVEVETAFEAARLAYLLTDHSVFFAMEPMPDETFRVYVKEEAVNLVKGVIRDTTA